MKSRKLVIIGLITIVALLIGSINLWAGKGDKGKKPPYLPGEISMKAVIQYDESYGILPDVPSPYTDGSNGVRAVLDPSRDFVLDTRDSDRHFELDFDIFFDFCLGGGGEDIPFTGTVPANFFSTFGLIDEEGNPVNDRLLGMQPGETFRSGAQVFFTVEDDPNFQYFLRFDPEFVGEKTGVRSHVWITRGTGEDKCTWTIEAGAGPCDINAEDNDCGLALLLKRSIRGKPKATFVTMCRMPFELTVVYQNPDDCSVTE